MKLSYMTWFDLERAIRFMVMHGAFVGAKEVAGIPRGGLPIAVGVSNFMRVPMVPLEEAKETTLVIDDIADTGRTMEHITCGHKAVWVRRASCPVNVWCVDIEHTDAWVVFPWENGDEARANYERYCESRGLIAADQ